MLKVMDRDHLRSVMKFARESGRIEQLKDQLRYLGSYAEHDNDGKTRCRLYADFAPQSFYFWMDLHRDHVRDPSAVEFDEDGFTPWFNGGLIFHGSHDNGGDGGAPTFSVNLTPTDGWSVHT